MSPLSDKAIAVLRTLTFGAWSAGLAWLLTKFAIPAVLEVHLDALGQTVLVWLLMAVLYPLLQRVEAKLPPWLTRILLGSNKAPTYIDQGGNVLSAPAATPRLGGVVPGPGNASKLTYAATTRCPCGLGLAYLSQQMDYWDCSGILLGTADTGVQHTARLPFVFYEIKSDQQPSAGGASTRPA